MPIDYTRYPKDWKAISRRVREQAGNKCQWCGVPNGVIGYRDTKGVFHELDEGAIDTAILDGLRVTKIVLTVAHLGVPKPDGSVGDKHDKHDVRDENLAALCQKCHLGYDLDDHVRHAAETRRRKRIEQGQQVLV